MNRSAKVVRFFRNDLKEENITYVKQNCGRKRILSERDIRRLNIIVERDRFVTA